MNKEELEELKLQLEIKKLNLPWYRNMEVWKSIFPTLALLASLYFAYGKGWLDIEKSKLERDKLMLEWDKRNLKNEINEFTIQRNEAKQAYEKDQIAYNKNLKTLKEQNDFQKAQQELLIIEYEKRIKNQGVQANAETKRLNDELNKIKAEQQATEIRAVEISDKLISNWLIESDWKIEFIWKGKEPDFFGCKFIPNGKWLKKDVGPLDKTWQIKNGILTLSSFEKLSSSIGVLGIVKKHKVTRIAIVSKMQTPIEGTMSDDHGKSGTWKMTKESNAAN